MVSNPGTQAIFDRMRGLVRTSGQQSGSPSASACGSAFTLDDFSVADLNGELIANVVVTAIPAGATLQGVTVVASPPSPSPDIYCMGVAGDSAGLTVPVSVLGASTSPAFSSATVVIGMVVLDYTQDGTSQQCTITQQFTVGG